MVLDDFLHRRFERRRSQYGYLPLTVFISVAKEIKTVHTNKKAQSKKALLSFTLELSYAELAHLLCIINKVNFMYLLYSLSPPCRGVHTYPYSTLFVVNQT
jgi:hypothetical protein